MIEYPFRERVSCRRVTHCLRRINFLLRRIVHEFIVIGQVTVTREWSSQIPTDSEHNPHLKLATIKVEKAFKGAEQGKTYEFLFAADETMNQS